MIIRQLRLLIPMTFGVSLPLWSNFVTIVFPPLPFSRSQELTRKTVCMKKWVIVCEMHRTLHRCASDEIANLKIYRVSVFAAPPPPNH